MNKFYVRLVSAAVVITGIIALASLASPVLAQDPTPTPLAEATDVPTPVPGDAASTAQILPILKSPEFMRLASSTLWVTFLMWAILFLYTYFIHERFIRATVELAKSGFSVVPTIIGTEPLLSSNIEAASGFEIKGPKIVTVGVPSEEYKITGPDGKPLDVQATWTVDPSSAAVSDPATGPTTKVIALVSGAFDLKVESRVNNESGSRQGSFPVVAIPPQAGQKVELPVFGRGYGTIAIAIVILAIVLILGLSTILPGAAIATLLGTLAGYIFSKAVPARSNGNGASKPPSTEEDQ